MADADDLDSAFAAIAEDDTPVADAEAVARRIKAVELLNVARGGLHKSGQAFQEIESGFAIDGPHIGASLVRPINELWHLLYSRHELLFSHHFLELLAGEAEASQDLVHRDAAIAIQ